MLQTFLRPLIVGEVTEGGITALPAVHLSGVAFEADQMRTVQFQVSIARNNRAGRMGAKEFELMRVFTPVEDQRFETGLSFGVLASGHGSKRSQTDGVDEGTGRSEGVGGRPGPGRLL